MFQISRAEAAAKLALDCGSVDELESRLSAFAGIVSQVRLPGVDGNQNLVDLRGHLDQLLGGDSAARAHTAVDDLRAFVAQRVWRQHPGADREGQEGARRRGITLPNDDWDGVWRHLRSRAVAALSVIREEIEMLSAAS